MTLAHTLDPATLPTWDLTHLYPNLESEHLKSDLAKVTEQVHDFTKAWQGKLDGVVKEADAPQQLHQAIATYEQIEDMLGRIMSYAGLVYASNNVDPKNAKFYGDMQDKITTISSELLFFTLELNKLDDALLEKAATQTPLSHYKPWLDDLRCEKPHQLDDTLEKLFHEKSVTGRAAWNRLYDETLASLRFDLRGESLTLEQTLNKMQDSDSTLRKDAAEALGKVFKANLRIFTLITNTLAKDKDISDRWRHFNDSPDSRHLANRVEPEVVDAMIIAVRHAYPRLSHRYYKLKAKWFGVEQLDYWDRNAPLPQIEQAFYPWDDAKNLVLTAYNQFSPHMSGIARRFFDENWIDAPTRPGKSSGAFSHPTVPSAHPYVLLNYQGKPRDVMTLAHELGHGVHQVMAGPQGALMAPTPLTLAETASVFGEMLTFRKLLSQTTDMAKRKALLASKVEDMLNTVVRQIAFYTFERKLHKARKSGELTADAICDLWMSVQSESLGEAIRFGEGYETFWTYIPHFIHSPFYVYAYAFGDCLVNSLYGIYEKSEDGFVERYFALLSAGGSKPYGDLLKPFGLDPRDPSFWQIGLSLIERMIGELETMDDN